MVGRAEDAEDGADGAAAELSAWTSIRGYLTTEVFGSLHQLTADPCRRYRAHICTVMAGMGYDPALIPDTA